jgi:CrcB protein
MGRDPREEGAETVMALTPAALLLVAIGGAIGSAARFAISVLALHALGAAFPWGTLAVNIIGSAAIGVAAGSGMEGQLRLLVVTGFLGGFTTFSAFSLETATLFERSPALAALYVAASVGLGLAAFWVAWLLAKA